MKYSRILFLTTLFIVCPWVWADSAHPYPEKPLTANQIAHQVFLSLHGMHHKNIVLRKKKGQLAIVINRVPGKNVSVNTLEVFINNDFDDGITESKQLAIFKSGKLKGTGILMTIFRDSTRKPSVALWLPSLRKVRRMLAPNQADKWMGTNLTFGDVFLRKPEHEIHELLGTAKFSECLSSIVLSQREKTKRTKNLPKGSCAPVGREVYRLKSTTKFKDWWYDYHISDIDTETFAPYRTRYFKEGKQVKFIEVDWISLNKPDPRIVVPRYIYAKSLKNGQESMLITPLDIIEFNTDLPGRFWSEGTLRKIKR